MHSGQTIMFLVILGAIAIVLALIWFVLRRRKTGQLRDRFGGEYDRTVDRVGGRGKAERNLAEREKRVATFRIHPLTAQDRERFTQEWRETKTLFVDSPREAVLRGDRLVGAMMEKRGFPVEDFDRRYEDLTVNHAEVANHYREGHEIAQKGGEATTEEMRRALNHYEKLFEEMIRDAEDIAGPGDKPVAANGERANEPSVTYDGEERSLRPG